MDREELVEKMAEAINASSAAALPWAKLIDEAAQYPYSETWVRFCRDAARAALAVAEPAVFCSECHTSADSAAARNRRAPSAEETRLRAEVASLRATLGQQPAAEGAEPIGCPLPGACGAVRAHAAAFRAGAAEMRERAAEQVDCGCSWRADALAATNKGERFVACGNDPCGAIEARAIRALPLPATPPEGEG